MEMTSDFSLITRDRSTVVTSAVSEAKLNSTIYQPTIADETRAELNKKLPKNNKSDDESDECGDDQMPPVHCNDTPPLRENDSGSRLIQPEEQLNPTIQPATMNVIRAELNSRLLESRHEEANDNEQTPAARDSNDISP